VEELKPETDLKAFEINFWSLVLHEDCTEENKVRRIKNM
jgi:hypothetical protein